MPDVISLDDAMNGALVTALEAGVLERWPGGYWTVPSCDVERLEPSVFYGHIRVPSYRIGVGIVALLVRRGDLEITKTEGGIWTEVRPTEQARSLV